jgi:hypothetical protein
MASRAMAPAKLLTPGGKVEMLELVHHICGWDKRAAANFSSTVAPCDPNAAVAVKDIVR